MSDFQEYSKRKKKMLNWSLQSIYLLCNGAREIAQSEKTCSGESIAEILLVACNKITELQDE